MLKKTYKDNKGFTLTEVMVGIMILTMAIVAASNMLVTLMRSNQVNLTSMQAQYFAVEGLEAVRSIRDTNWLHNQGWLGDSKLGYQIGDKIGDEAGFAVQLSNVGWDKKGEEDLSSLYGYFPWEITDDGTIKKCIGLSMHVYFGADCSEETAFNRIITIEKYDCKNSSGDKLEQGSCKPEDSILVTSTVSWNIGEDNRDLSLSTVLTDWKGGAF